MNPTCENCQGEVTESESVRISKGRIYHTSYKDCLSNSIGRARRLEAALMTILNYEAADIQFAKRIAREAIDQ